MATITVVGRLGRDPEIRFVGEGLPLMTMTLAENERRKRNGEWVDVTEWHRVTMFGNRAEPLSNILKKGQMVFVEGSLQSNQWTDKEGNERTGWNIIARDIKFVSSPGEKAPKKDSDDLPF
jgi:single-strand DNA-binding protein